MQAATLVKKIGDALSALSEAEAREAREAERARWRSSPRRAKLTIATGYGQREVYERDVLVLSETEKHYIVCSAEILRMRVPKNAVKFTEEVSEV